MRLATRRHRSTVEPTLRRQCHCRPTTTTTSTTTYYSRVSSELLHWCCHQCCSTMTTMTQRRQLHSYCCCYCHTHIYTHTHTHTHTTATKQKRYDVQKNHRRKKNKTPQCLPILSFLNVFLRWRLRWSTHCARSNVVANDIATEKLFI